MVGTKHLDERNGGRELHNGFSRHDYLDVSVQQTEFLSTIGKDDAGGFDKLTGGVFLGVGMATPDVTGQHVGLRWGCGGCRVIRRQENHPELGAVGP